MNHLLDSSSSSSSSNSSSSSDASMSDITTSTRISDGGTAATFLQSSSQFLQKSSREFTMLVQPSVSRSQKIADQRLLELKTRELKIQSIGLIGRERETEKLQSCLISMMDEQQQQQQQQAAEESRNHKQKIESIEETISTIEISKVKKKLVFIKGFSGVGKTTLARTMQLEVMKGGDGCYVEGKFDLNMNHMDQPYAGIAKAFRELVTELSVTNPDMLSAIGQGLCEMLGPEQVEHLSDLIPELTRFVEGYHSSTSKYAEGNIDGMLERWKYSFRVLTRLLTSHVKPLVIMIDDLQWADKASLDIIETLITDSQNVNPLMIIGCYRSNEVNESSNLKKSIESLIQKQSKFGFFVTDIVVRSCGIDEVDQMIRKMMDVDEEEEESTHDLADLCFRRTLGNPFFVIEFMSMLQRENLIQFNIGTLKWSFDVSVIEEATFSTANVAEMLKSRMEQMPADVKLLLRVAACLGPTFGVSILETLWKNLPYIPTNSSAGLDNIPKLITFIESELLIEAWAGDKYRWVHDKVQEAALSLVESDEVNLKFHLGKALYYNLQGIELEDSLFDIIDLITSEKGPKSVEFASLCLKAATKAKRLSAFQSATRYAKRGIEMLPEDKWTSSRSLTIELHAIGAQVELALGRVEESKNHCDAVLSRKDTEIGDRIPFKLVEIQRLSTVEMKYPDAIKSCLSLLKDMNNRLFWSRTLLPVQAIYALSKTIKTIKRLPKDFYLRIGRMDSNSNNNNNKIMADILERIRYSSYHTKEIFQMILGDCKSVHLTLQHGLCEHSGHSFAMIGFYTTVLFKDFEDAALFRELALSTQSHFGKPRACQTIFLSHFSSLAWTVPIQSFASSSVLYESYVTGMQNGEVDFAMWSLMAHFVQIPIILGKPIDQILEAFPKIIAQMEEVSQTSQAVTTTLYWQMLLNLREPKQAKDPLKLTRGNNAIIENHPDQEDEYIATFRDYLECQLLLFYNHESAADRAIQSAGRLEKAAPGTFDFMIETFHRGICLYVAARRTKRRKYAKHAKKIRKIIHEWRRKGIPNVVYYCMFLDAEHAALAGKHEEAEKHYKEAIHFVAKPGHLQHAALFNELYSDYLFRERDDKDEAKYRLEEAIWYYRDWGALGKVEKLKESSLLLYEEASG
ncbi:unnamed protein product [Cylindrotheca closterium]|uniref:Orc1-like AAA ATPase domain-containing protein n=1 Tax=Cylindrotheca closterium TaxID=2856 RepID=A0AAD2FKZ7_9STRA|nr:unnamed protein product [Cylindrotheca closterium]